MIKNVNFYLLINMLCGVWYSFICLMYCFDHKAPLYACVLQTGHPFLLLTTRSIISLFSICQGVGSLEGINSRLLCLVFLLNLSKAVVSLSTSLPFPRNGLVSYPLGQQFCFFEFLNAQTLSLKLLGKWGMSCF